MIIYYGAGSAECSVNRSGEKNLRIAQLQVGIGRVTGHALKFISVPTNRICPMVVRTVPWDYCTDTTILIYLNLPQESLLADYLQSGKTKE